MESVALSTVLRVEWAALLDRLEAPLEGRSRTPETRWGCKRGKGGWGKGRDDDDYYYDL